jgi:CubicO group peptidase (beta-lactamase class C family)
MKKVFFVLLIIILQQHSDAQRREGARFYLRENLDKLKNRMNVPALCGTLVIDGEIVAFAATGIRKYGSTVKVTDTDLFAIGSVTKTITGFLAAKIIQDNPGLISWTTTIKDLYPELQGLPGTSNEGP